MTVKNNSPLESEEARILMEYCQLKNYRFHHSKNETGRPNASGKVRNWKAVWDKRDGVSPGFPDYVIVTKTGVYFIELKRVRGSSTSEDQKLWINDLVSAGANAKICHGASEAIRFIDGTIIENDNIVF